MAEKEAARRCFVESSYKTYEADFIMWGHGLTYDEGNNALARTFAIVEDDKGKVHEVDPARITFIK